MGGLKIRRLEMRGGIQGEKEKIESLGERKEMGNHSKARGKAASYETFTQGGGEAREERGAGKRRARIGMDERKEGTESY